MKNTLFLISFFISVIAFENSWSQPGCPGVNAGTDLSPDCNTPCVDLTATAVFTGATTSYTVSSVPYNPPYLYNTGNPILVNKDDWWSGKVPLPFKFCFFGNQYDTIVVGANGCLTFNTALALKPNKPLQTLSCPNPNIVKNDIGPYIFGCYQDLDPSNAGGGSIYQAVLGVYPCRTFVLNFYNVALYPQNPPLCLNMSATFQIVLYESTNVVEVYVENKPLCTAWNNGNTVIGIQNGNGTLGYTPPGRNTGPWSATNEAWRFTPDGIPNFSFTWYEGIMPIGNTPTINVCPTTTTTYTSEVIYDCCTGTQVKVTDDVTVNVTPGLNLTINNSSPAVCIGGTSTLSVTSADPATTFLWNNGTPGNTITVNPTIKTIYCVTGTTPLCTMQICDSVDVLTNPVISPSSNSPVCTGNPLYLYSGASGGFTYNWSGPNNFTSNLQDPVISNVTSAASGNYSVTVTSSSGMCTAGGITTVIINSTPVATASDNSPLCSGETLNLTSSGGTSVWTGPNAFSSSLQNPSVTPVTLAASGVYTVIVTNANGSCSDTAQTTVVINPSLTLSVTGTNVPCFGASTGAIDLTVTGGTQNYNYDWNNNAYTIEDPANIPAGTYNVTVTDANLCSATTSIIITQPASPVTANIAGTNVTCFGFNNGAANLSVSGGTNVFTYLWSNTLTTEDLSNLSPGVYTVTVTDNAGCKVSQSVSITEPPLLSISFVTTDVLCFGGSTGTISVTPSGGTQNYSYSWSPPISAGNVSSVNNLSAQPYTVTVTDNKGCTVDTAFTISEPPALTLTYITDSVNCFGESNGSINISPKGGVKPYSFIWSPMVSQDTVALNLAAGNYNVTVTDKNGCTTSAVIPVYEPPQLVMTISGNDTICTGQSSTISATSTGGTGSCIFFWDQNLGTGNIFTVTPPYTTTYTVFGTDHNGCLTSPQSLTVFISTPITVNLTANPAAVCKGENVDLTATPAGGNFNYIYSWGQGITASSQTVTVTPDSTMIYSVSVTDACGSLAGIDSVQVFVYPLPVIQISSDITAGCMPLDVVFSNSSSPPGTTWSWNFGDPLSGANDSSDIMNPRHLYMLPGLYDVSLNVTSANGCTGSYTFQGMINVYPIPVAEFTPEPRNTLLFYPTINFTDNSTNAVSWNWNFGDPASGILDSSDLQNPVHIYSDTGTYTITLTITAPNGCSDSFSDSVKIKPKFTLYAPNAFTPNADGKNDFFNVQGEFWDKSSYQMYIYDRWGNLVFSSEDSNIPWNGNQMYKNEPAHGGVYVWILYLNEYTGKPHLFSGRVTLVR